MPKGVLVFDVSVEQAVSPNPIEEPAEFVMIVMQSSMKLLDVLEVSELVPSTGLVVEFDTLCVMETVTVLKVVVKIVEVSSEMFEEDEELGDPDISVDKPGIGVDEHP